ncbi:hypothetical protein PEBR_03405 [Penicillium brasilianum]|uniref:Alpha box domain-containing protein n=1 Tax=Penicillium brasilianum TaxID=104259 RepID=A0A1S9RYY6_PENBI|nr:hypothetical protein PEBR_03405 [Penicillium brasilianum]
MFPNFELSSVDETPDWSLNELRFFDYLASIPYHRAIQLLNICSSRSDLSKLAKLALSYIPDMYFHYELPIFNGKHFEVINDQLTLVEAEGDGLGVLSRQIPPVRGVTQWKGGLAERPVRKRPLNSFMVFRAFIAPAFTGLTQREKSMIASRMWKDDPNKGDWFFIAHAYTTLRDNFQVFERSVPFFAEKIVCDMLLMPPPDMYALMFGVRITSTGPLTFQTGVNPTIPPLRFPPFTVDGCIAYYRANGFAGRQLNNSNYIPWAQRTLHTATLISQALNPFTGRPEDPLNWLFDDNDRLTFGVEEHDLQEIYGNELIGLVPDDDLMLI